jgi:3-oxoadipate enol-lactonase
MPDLETNGVRLHYRIEGPEDAQVVVLSNSLGTALGMWDAQLGTLTRRYRVLRYDSRGHGASEAPAGPYTIAMLADDVIGLLDGLGIERVHFCGLSLGGLVGQMLGARHGERLRSLTLCATACRLPPRELWDERIRLVSEEGMTPVADVVIERWFTPAFRAEPSIVVDRLWQMLLDTPPQGYAASCAALRDADLCAALGDIRVPTLVIAGGKDPVTPPARAEELAERIAGAQLEVIGDAAHLLNIEQDIAFDAALIAFLDRHRK